jgi:hypothetical protein
MCGCLSLVLSSTAPKQLSEALLAQVLVLVVELVSVVLVPEVLVSVVPVLVPVEVLAVLVPVPQTGQITLLALLLNRRSLLPNLS